MNVLAVDIGGTHIKFKTQRGREIEINSGPRMTPTLMIEGIKKHSNNWRYDRVSIGYPGPVVHNRPIAEPHNLGKGWLRFDFEKAFGSKPLQMINDAAMQALGSYKGGRMLFLGLGTGLGSAMVVDGVVQAMEIAHVHWRRGKTYEEFLGLAALKSHGKKRWRKHVFAVIGDLKAGLVCDYVVLGGGNARLLRKLPKSVFLGANQNAFEGALQMWKEHHKALK